MRFWNCSNHFLATLGLEVLFLGLCFSGLHLDTGLLFLFCVQDCLPLELIFLELFENTRCNLCGYSVPRSISPILLVAERACTTLRANQKPPGCLNPKGMGLLTDAQLSVFAHEKSPRARCTCKFDEFPHSAFDMSPLCCRSGFGAHHTEWR